MLIRLLARSSWRFYRQHPAQLFLSLIGIMLGVAIVTAVLITNHSSQRAFALSSEALYGRTTHQLAGALGLDQESYVRLRRDWPLLPMAPIIQAQVAIADELFTVLGIDPFSEAGFDRLGAGILPQSATASGTPSNALTQAARDLSSTQSQSVPQMRDTARLLLGSDALAVSRQTAERRGWNIGQKLQIVVGGRTVEATLAATFDTDNPAAADGLLVTDIAFAQSLLQRAQHIDRVDLILDEAQHAALQASLPPTLSLRPALSRQQTMQAMTRGFHINLTAMSLLALVVGVFLIHNTMSFAVVQRREIFAIKRMCGIRASTLLFSILAEALVISLVGSLSGVALGFVVAHGLIRLTTQTINDLYFTLHVQQIWFSPWLIGAGLILGVGSSLLAASLSAMDAAATSPVQARQRSLIEQRTGNLLPYLAAAGLLLVLIGALLAALPLPSLLPGFAALMLLILGYGLSLPWLVRHLARFCRSLLSPGMTSLSLAIGGIERNISRTGLAIAALCIAVSATFGVEIMIGSFRSSVDQWLGNTLQSDIYVSAPDTTGGQSDVLLSPDFAERARAIHGVRSVSTGRSLNVATELGDINMLVLEAHVDDAGEGYELLDMSSSRARQAWTDWGIGEFIMISEPLATRHALSAGQSISLFTEKAGMQPFTIAAVFRDFGSSHGKLLISRQRFSTHWNDDRIASLGVLLREGADATQLQQQLRQSLASSEKPLLIQANQVIHERSLAIFDRTFEVTRVLRWLTVGVAFVGIFSALLALQLERAREFAIIRACGATRWQIMQVVVVQTLVMGLFAGLLALPLGGIMSEILIHVINVRSFGWRMQSLLPPGALGETLLLASLSAVLAGLYPAWRLSRAPVASQLRDD